MIQRAQNNVIKNRDKTQNNSKIKLKLTILFPIILGMITDLKHTNSYFRLQECLHFFQEGMNISEKVQIPVLIDCYKQNYSIHYESILKKYGYMLENYCLYYIQRYLFPYQITELSKKFLYFMIEFSLLQILLVGIAASSKGLTTEMVIQVFQSYSKLF